MGKETYICQSCFEFCMSPKAIREWNKSALSIPSQFTFKPELKKVARALGWGKTLTAKEILHEIQNYWNFEPTRAHRLMFELADAGYLVYDRLQKESFEPDWNTFYKINDVAK
jgi:hypothetical protein